MARMDEFVHQLHVMVKALNGRESSILALIAQSQNLDLMCQQRLLKSLTGDALLIAKAMLGITKRPKRKIAKAANGFQTWADGLNERKS